MKSLGIIGFGNMGEAMISGVLENHKGIRLNVIEKLEARRKVAIETYKAIDCTDNPEKLFDESDAIVLAIKPQDIGALAAQVKGHTGNTRLISIAAGVSIDQLDDFFAPKMISRFMPSLAASIGKSVTAVSYSESCDEEFKNLAFSVAESMGMAVEMPERLIPAIIGVSGSGIAFVYEFIHALALGGVKEGIKYDSSLEIALDVLEGAVGTIRDSGLTPSDLITRVCSPGGTTIAGIESLHDNRFSATVMNAVSTAARRARDLEN